MRTSGVLAVALVLGLSAACGGGAATTRPATDDAGNVLTTADGTEVSRVAHERWTAALASFNRIEGEGGWTSDRCSASVDAFEAANSAQGGNFTEAIYMMGLSAARCHNESRARELYEQALRTNDKFCKARAAVGVMQMDAGRTEEAFNTFQRSIRDDPRCTEGYVNVAVIQRTRGGAQVREALNNLRRALAIDANYLPAFNQMALLYLGQAQSRNNEQMLDLAEVVCRQAQLIDSSYAPIYNTWGLIKMEKGDVIEATQFFERAMQLDPDMFAAIMNFGQVTIGFRGYEDAQRAFTKAIELQPNNYDAHIGLGAALRGLRQMDGAKAEYERAVALDGQRPEAYYNLGILYQDYMSGEVEDLRRAKGFYEQFLSRAGSNQALSDAVDGVRRRCRQQRQRRRRRRRRSDCRPGRMQNIDTAVEALQAAAEVQRQMERQQRQQGGGG